MKFEVTVRMGRKVETFEIEITERPSHASVLRILKEKVFKKRPRRGYRILDITRKGDDGKR